MTNGFKFMWRCIKCGNHFANIEKMEGRVKQEKKCQKCKSLNTLTLDNKEIFIHCRLYDPNINGYGDQYEESLSYPSIVKNNNI